MSNNKPFPDPATAHALEEADIGSGEKTPGQLETEQLIREIPALPPSADWSQDDADDSDAADSRRERREHDASLQRDEPADDLDGLDPVPPKGS